MGRSTQTQDQYIVRLPDGLRDRIKEAAAANNRSMNAEIVARLLWALPGGGADDQFSALLNERDSLVLRVAQLQAQVDDRVDFSEEKKEIETLRARLLRESERLMLLTAQRIPEGLYERIGKAAERNRRSPEEEVVQTLEEAFPVVAELDRMVAALETMLKPLEEYTPQNAEQATHLATMRGHLLQMQRTRYGSKSEVDATLDAFFTDFPGFRDAFFHDAPRLASSQSAPEPSAPPAPKARSSAKGQPAGRAKRTKGERG